MKKIILCGVCFLAIFVGICIAWMNRYHVKNYNNITPVQELGLYQRLEIEDGQCSFEVPPSRRSGLQPFLRPMQSWYGVFTLSDESTATLLRNYDWEVWTISETEWNHQKDEETVTDFPYSHFYMFEFDVLKTRFVDKEYYVSQLFDKEQDNTHRIGQLYSYFDPGNRAMLFYYTSS